MNSSWRKWLAFGTGAGVEIDGNRLQAAVVRVRPSAIQTLATKTIEGVRERPAVEWGAELSGFLKETGISGRSIAVVLPARELISRTVALPGVPKKELASALSFELDALTPYGTEEAASAWSPVGDGAVLLGITRSATVAHFADLFVEAGIPVASFTTPAAAIYSSRHLIQAEGSEFLAVDAREEETRVYAESSRPAVFWAVTEFPPERAVALARAQLRLGDGLEPPAVLTESTLAIAAATVAACPWLSAKLNLLPRERRVSRSPWTFAPTTALVAMTAIAAIVLTASHQLEDRRLLKQLNQEIANVEPVAHRAANAERAYVAATARIERLKTFRERTRKDLEVLKETTKLLAPPARSTQLDLTRTTLSIAGESNAAAELLKVLDASPMFKNTEFIAPLGRANTAGMDVFRIRTEREGPAK